MGCFNCFKKEKKVEEKNIEEDSVKPPERKLSSVPPIDKPLMVEVPNDIHLAQQSEDIEEPVPVPEPVPESIES
jgi:hypothetical protein